MNALNPRPQTYEVLGRSRNTAAIGVLQAGLLSSLAEVRGQCVQLLLGRQELAAREAIVSTWKRLDEAIHSRLANNRFELEPACRGLLMHGDANDKEAAIQAVNDLDMTSALPELIPVALDKSNPLHEPAMQTLCGLCDRWGQRARNGRDVPSTRTAMIEAMLRYVHGYPSHKNADLVDAWLMLVTWEDSAQRAIINDPLHAAYRPVLDRLCNSPRSSVMQLLGGYLWRASTPKSILSIICERTETELAVRIATMVDDNLLAAVLRRLRELPPMASLTGLATRPASVGMEVQRRLWLMLAANSPSMEPVLCGAVTISKMGSSEYRRMAADIVRNCRQRDVEQLVQHLQSAAANPDDAQSLGAQLRAMIGWIDGPSTVLSAASREFFAEFTLARLLDVMRKWPTPMCRVLAEVVSRIEPDIVPQLLKALESPAPKRRLMALQVIRLLDVSSEINERLLPLVHDPRVEVRVPAIDLLGALMAPELAAMLPELLADPTTDIQDAAIRAQRRFERRGRRVQSSQETTESSALPLASLTLPTNPDASVASITGQ